jgi:long-chain acyl-CoA synthetase
LAALGSGLVTVPLYVNDRPENSAYILRETGSRLVLLDEEEQWLRIEEVASRLPRLERIVMLHPMRHARSCSDTPKAKDASRTGMETSRGVSAEVNAYGLSRRNPGRNPRLSDLATWLPEKGGGYIVNCQESTELATVVFTSGTTGVPKGVMLSHANILENAFACLQRESIYRDDLFLSFLPLSHTFERTVGYYLPMMAGACVAYVRSIDKLSEDLTEVRPTILICPAYENYTVIGELAEKPFLHPELFHLAAIRDGSGFFIARSVDDGRLGFCCGRF